MSLDVEILLLFSGVGLIPSDRHAKMGEAPIQWNYTTVLNIIFLVLAALLYRFVRTGGMPMQDDERSTKQRERA